MANYRCIHSANAMIDQLRGAFYDECELRRRFCKERQLLAMLSAEGPCFANPLDAMAAATLRDEILRRECKLNPDGTRIKPTDQPAEGA